MSETADTADTADTSGTGGTAATRIEAIELHRVEVPLVRPFETSFGRESVREVLMVRVRTVSRPKLVSNGRTSGTSMRCSSIASIAMSRVSLVSAASAESVIGPPGRGRRS